MAKLLISAFEGLTDEDFEVYAPPCWSSNLKNLPRMKTKERVVAVAAALRDALDMEGLVLEASSEIPSVWNNREVRDQWAFVLRDADARRTLAPVVARHQGLQAAVQNPAEHHRHLLLYVRLHHEGLEVGLGAHQHATVDLANLLGRARTDGEALRGLVDGLPEGMRGEGADPVQGLLDSAREAHAGEAERFAIAEHIGRDAAVAAGADLADRVRGVAELLRPLFEYIAWSPSNDHVGVGEALDELEAARAKRHSAQAEARTEKAKAREVAQQKAEARQDAMAAAEAAFRKLQAKSVEAGREKAKAAPPHPTPTEPKSAEPKSTEPAATAEKPERAQQPARPKRETPSRAAKPTGRHQKPAARGQKPAEPRSGKKGPPARSRPAPDLEVGDTVRMVRGLLAGKEGVVKAKDKKGMFRVAVGNLEVPVAAHDLEKAE